MKQLHWKQVDLFGIKLTILLAGHHHFLKKLVGEHENVCVLAEKLLEMEITFSNEVKMIGYGQTSLVMNSKQLKAERASNALFTDFVSCMTTDS